MAAYESMHEIDDDDYFPCIKVDTSICKQRRAEFQRNKPAIIASWAMDGIFDGALSPEQIDDAILNGRLPSDFEIHHIVPLVYGGTNDESNLCVLSVNVHHQVNLIYDALKGIPETNAYAQETAIQAPKFTFKGKTIYTKPPRALTEYIDSLQTFALRYTSNPSSFDIKELFDRTTARQMRAFLIYNEESVTSFYHQKRNKKRAKLLRNKSNLVPLSVKEAFYLSQHLGYPVSRNISREEALLYAALSDRHIKYNIR